MPGKTVQPGEFKPFLSPVLLEATGTQRGRALLKKAVAEASEPLRLSSSRRTRKLLHTGDVDRHGELFLQVLVYRETGPAPWSASGAFKDVSHQLLVIAVRDRILALCASDGAMRDRVVKALTVGRKLPRAAIAAFVGQEAKALWLNGIHSPTASKPDTKALTGGTLEYALDPIGDQTYYYSAARTVPNIPALKSAAGKPTVVGAAPGEARVWINRPENWNEFKAMLSAVMNHAITGAHTQEPFATLARPVDQATDIADAYDLSVVSEALLSEDEVPAHERDLALRWSYQARYEVQALPGASLRVKPYLDGQALGVLELDVSIKDGEATLKSTWKHVEPAMSAQCKELGRFLQDPAHIKIHYESGHSIAQGRCYEGGYSDQPFPWEYRSFAGYDIGKEKPSVPKGGSLAAQIAMNGDKSLFAYVCERMFLGQDGKPKGWLACDDGSMELADFVHIDPVAKVISLIHIKASDSTDPDRQAAPTDYEVVVSQAVKNLRYLDRRMLADELERGKGKKIGAAVWHDGVRQPDRIGFLAQAKKLPRSASKCLIVLQPRITEREWKRCRADEAMPSHALRIRQIDTLLLAARASALSCGATFEAVGDAD